MQTRVTAWTSYSQPASVDQEACIKSVLLPSRTAKLHPSFTRIRTSARASSRIVRARSAGQDDVDLISPNRQPEDVRGAIAVGLSLYESAQYKEALEVFEKALKLPGTGSKRYRDKPRSISDGEKQSVLYNIACCYSRLGDARTGLVALAGCLEAGYEDVNQLRKDPDLEFLRSDKRFEGLIDRFKLSTRKGFFDSFLKGFNL